MGKMRGCGATAAPQRRRTASTSLAQALFLWQKPRFDIGLRFALPESMTDSEAVSPRLAPIFILVDDDREAIEQIQKRLHVEWYYVPIWETTLAVRYANHFATTAIFLADPVGYPDGGTARLLQDLLDRVGKPVVILSEVWSTEIAARWNRMGASDCIPHPTRCNERMEGLRSKMEDFALGRSGALSAAGDGRPLRDERKCGGTG